MSNPFDDQDGTFLVLVNDEGQHSLWPAFAQQPDGWKVALGEGPRDAALAFVEELDRHAPAQPARGRRPEFLTIPRIARRPEEQP